jgi:hypothetical protein
MTSRRCALVAISAGALAPVLAIAQNRAVKRGMISARPLAYRYAKQVVPRLEGRGYRAATGTKLEFPSVDGHAEDP